MKSLKEGPIVWIFDLDDTLHHATPRIFPQINATMTRYLMHHLDLDAHGADTLRAHYWQRYGATLHGLIRHHGIDPHHFLRETHPATELAALAQRMAGLHDVLRRLPGRKIVFTNGPIRYARAVLRKLHADGLFAGIIGIEGMRFQPKPQIAGYRRLLRLHRLKPERCIMVDDSHDNIARACRLGMHGIWLGQRHRPNSRLRRIRRLSQLLRLRLPPLESKRTGCGKNPSGESIF